MLPESGGATVCMQFSGTITAEDHLILIETVERCVKDHGYVDLLLYYNSSFNGWEPEAADANMKGIIEFGQFTRKLAYVNPPQKKIIQHKLTPDLFRGELRYFEESQLKDALLWIKS